MERLVVEALASVVCPVTPNDPATPRRYAGVVEPIPTLPLAKIVKSEAPVDEATLKGLSGDEVDDCTLNVKVDDVALTPSTAPLSIREDVPRVVEVSQRVANPIAPPVREDDRPRDDVATHCVDVPVVWRTIPRVPDAEVLSRSAPVRLRLVE